MAYRKGVLAAVLAGFLAGGCGPSRVVHRRAWTGGSFTKASKSIFAKDYQAKARGSVRALPKEVSKGQSGGLVVSALEKESPLALGGVRPGDLVISVNHEPISSLGSYRRIVDRIVPGSEVIVTVWRNGDILDIPVVAGTEAYKRIGYLNLGFGFGTTMKLWPDPDFNLFDLVRVRPPGRRNSIHAPEYAYLLSVKPKAEVRNGLWDVWLGVIGVGRYDVILSQDAAGAEPKPAEK